jgi:hypothetical protein
MSCININELWSILFFNTYISISNQANKHEIGPYLVTVGMF